MYDGCLQALALLAGTHLQWLTTVDYGSQLSAGVELAVLLLTGSANEADVSEVITNTALVYTDAQ